MRPNRALAFAAGAAVGTGALMALADSGAVASLITAALGGLGCFLALIGGRSLKYGVALLIILLVGGVGLYLDASAKSNCDWESTEGACQTSVFLLLMAAMAGAAFLGFSAAALTLFVSGRFQKSMDNWFDTAARRAALNETVTPTPNEIEEVARELADEAAESEVIRASHWRKRLSSVLTSGPETIGREADRLVSALRSLRGAARETEAATVAEVEQEFSDAERGSLEQLLPAALLESLAATETKNRPRVGWIAWYFRVMGWAEILVGIVALAWPSELETDSTTVAMLLGVAVLVAGVGTFVVAGGMDSLELWAWYAGIIMIGLAVSSGVAAIASGDGVGLLLLAVNIAAAWYLLTPRARAAFGVYWRPGKPHRARGLRIHGGPGLLR